MDILWPIIDYQNGHYLFLWNDDDHGLFIMTDAFKNFTEELCKQVELLKLLTIGRMDQSGDFKKGAGMSLDGAIFLIDVTSEKYATSKDIPTLANIYRLFQEINKSNGYVAQLDRAPPCEGEG